MSGAYGIICRVKGVGRRQIVVDGQYAVQARFLPSEAAILELR